MQLGTSSLWQAIQQMLGRRIGADLVTELLQTTSDRFAKGRIVVDNVHEPLHVSLPKKGLRVSKQLQPEHVNFMGFFRLADPDLGALNAGASYLLPITPRLRGSAWRQTHSE